ncbi:MAG TPA: hypothetical protein VLB27_10160 [candidate division Zixibacteria bacterium]|nr:hypothetical protein [candidate division Zixibacteria bacterium]
MALIVLWSLYAASAAAQFDRRQPRRAGAIGAGEITLRIDADTLGARGAVDTVVVRVDAGGTEIAAFDLTFAFDAAAFTIDTALPGEFLDSCGWEYFALRKNPLCPGPCPSGLVKVVALAEFQRRGERSVCHLPDSGATLIKFVVRRAAQAPVFADPALRFFWIDCGDNSVASVSGDDLFLAGSVMEPDLAPLPMLFDSAFPNFTGPLPECFAGGAVNAPRAKLALINGLVALGGFEREPAMGATAGDSTAADSTAVDSSGLR